ncbi:MAG: LPS-assembly protein LptD, partial [Thermoplasmata archaeon]|nr:LPS-assembly protein LptD [Thermoplasmata archaeon]
VDERLRVAVPSDSASATISDDGFVLGKTSVVDELRGRSIRMEVRDDHIHSIIVSGMAESEYNALEDSVLQGRNFVSGDTIIIEFSDDELSMISVKGGARGTFTPHKNNPDLDTTVTYSAGLIEYNVPGRITDLTSKSQVKYDELILDAGTINVNWNNSLLAAEGVYTPAPDSILDSGGDSLLYTGMPKLQQGNTNPVVGERMEYNIRTKRGRVTSGTTEYGEGFYRGEVINRVDKEVLTVDRGYYTTCDLPENPHFHFESDKMKLVMNDKVIARPVRLYIRNVPTPLWLPYAVFPNRRGRHSGFIMPSYGESSSEGRYLRGGGYYWAGSDYHDATLRMDFYDKTGFLFRMNSRYKLRYHLNGSLAGSVTRKNFGTRNQRRWDLKWNHNQTVDPTLKLKGSVNLVSDRSFYTDLSSNIDTRLNQQLRSNFT